MSGERAVGLVRYQTPDEVRSELAVVAPQLAEVLPAGMDAARFVRLVVKTIIGNPRLMECTRTSLLTAVMNAAELGLEPSGLLGSAYLVPYKNRRTGHMEAQLIPGYRGLIDLARRSGEIEAIEASTVRSRDTFRIIKGNDANVVHEPFVPDPTMAPEDRDPGPYVGAYMLATLRGGYRQAEWMTTDEIEAVRRRSRAADDGPWVTDWSEMARKTVVRRGSKYLPLTTDFRRALELDEEAERNADVSEPVAMLTPAQRLLAQRIEERHATEPEVAAEEAGSTPAAPQGAVEATEAVPGTSEDPDGHPGPAVVAPGEYLTGGNGLVRLPDDPSRVPVADATAICGDESPEMGACSRAPEHPGSHRNTKGVWPKVKR